MGVSFQAAITHPEIKRLLEANYKNVRVLLTDEMGYAGPYPGMGIDRQQAIEFKQKLIEHNVDAVIAGNGGCGICTPKETGSAIAAESLGIPAVVIAAQGFTDQAKYTAYNNGIAVLRTAEYPGAFATHTTEQLIENTRNVVWPQLNNLAIYDATGKMVARTNSNFNMRTLPAGVYMVYVQGIHGACKIVNR